MKRLIFLLGLLFPAILFSQTQSLWSKDSIKYSTSLQVYASQYTSPLYAVLNDFYFSDTLKKSNQYVAVHTWLVKDFNQDGYSDIFLGFFTGGELEKIPFKIYFYDTTSGKYQDKSYLINNNTGQSFNRKTMAADLNGDGIPDMVAVSHPECNSCQFSSFDILFSDKTTGRWNQNTLKTPNRNKGEGYFHGIALGDIDNDGDVDIVLANENTFSGGNITMTNDGKGNFTEKYSMNFFDKSVANYGTSWTTELVDINNDSYLDLLYDHDSTYRGVAYGDGSGTFGNKIEQRFPKTKYSSVMDYDAYDIDKDGDLDLILSTTDYNGWELIFLENAGNSNDGKVIWKDRSSEINTILIKNGFYSDNITKNWLPYLALADVNKDGIMDLMPQRPIDNYQGYWIIYGKGGWNFSYFPNSVPEKQTKINTQISNSGKLRVSWKKLIINKPTSNTAINSWKLYMHNKPFGDKGMVKLPPLLINNLNATFTNDSVIFITNLPYDTTYFRLSVIDSNSLETPLSDSSLYSCSLPPSPVVQSKNMCTGEINTNLLSFVTSTYQLQWYDSLTSSLPRSTISSFNSSIGNHLYFVSALNKCESYSKSTLSINIIQTPLQPALSRDSLNFLVANANGVIWYKDGIALKDTTQKFKPSEPGSYTIKASQNGCSSISSLPYYYLVTDVINLSTNEFIKLGPNPFVNQLNFDFVVKGYQRLNLEIFDMANGTKVASKQNQTPGMPIYLGQLSAGTYVIKVISNDNKISYQFKMVKL